jgi:hypothetical protein
VKENLTARAKHLWDNFKLTLEKWGIVFKYQGEVCAICGCTNKSGNRLSTDHRHSDGLFRGLLCARCNRLLGKIEDPRWQATPLLIERLAEYMRSPSAVKALGYEHYGYPGNVGTKAHRKLLKKLAKQELKKVVP